LRLGFKASTTDLSAFLSAIFAGACFPVRHCPHFGELLREDTMRKPFYKKSHHAWYCQLPSGKQHRLIQGEKAATKEAAETKYHELMADRQPARKADAGATLVKVLIDRFLVWTQ